MVRRLLGLLLIIGIASSSFAQQTPVGFTVCAQSNDWKRPSADVQSQIWGDPRYREPGPQAYQWTHNFLAVEPDSASIAYENQNLSGVWTELMPNQCPRRDGERGKWTELWSLTYHVVGISLTGLVYTITVAPHEGYEIIQFRRPETLGESRTTLRFVTAEGSVLTEWRETSSSVFVPQ